MIESISFCLLGRSKNQGKTAVEEAIQLRKARDIMRRRVVELEDTIMDGLSDLADVSSAEAKLPGLRAELERKELAVKNKERALGVGEMTELRRLVSSPYIAARMNARALKIRLREKLRARKFELDQVERAFRKQVNSTEEFSLFFAH